MIIGVVQILFAALDIAVAILIWRLPRGRRTFNTAPCTGEQLADTIQRSRCRRVVIRVTSWDNGLWSGGLGSARFCWDSRYGGVLLLGCTAAFTVLRLAAFIRAVTRARRCCQFETFSKPLRADFHQSVLFSLHLSFTYVQRELRMV